MDFALAKKRGGHHVTSSAGLVLRSVCNDEGGSEGMMVSTYVCMLRVQCECGCTQVVSVHCVVRSLFCGYCALCLHTVHTYLPTQPLSFSVCASVSPRREQAEESRSPSPLTLK